MQVQPGASTSCWEYAGGLSVHYRKDGLNKNLVDVDEGENAGSLTLRVMPCMGSKVQRT